MAEWDFAMWKRNTASSDLPLFYRIGKCSYSSGASTRIAFALFYRIGKCSYSSGVSTRIAFAILGVQSAGFALF